MLGAKETLMLLDVLRPTAIVVIRWINAVRMHLHSDAIMNKQSSSLLSIRGLYLRKLMIRVSLRKMSPDGSPSPKLRVDTVNKRRNAFINLIA